jgi:hypothetical protein
MNSFFLALALALAFVAGAPSIWASPVPCATKAKPLIDVDHTDNNLGEGWVFHLLDSGAWTLLERGYDRKAPPPLVEVGQGCFDAAAMSSLKGKLARATWKVTHRDPCTALRMDTQSYAVGGKQVWFAMQCSGEQLDAASANAIDAIDALLKSARSANKKQP